MTPYESVEQKREKKRQYSREYRLSHPGRAAQQSAKWRAAHPEYREAARKNLRAWQLKNNYGLSPEDYDRMLAEQGGGCAICGSKSPGRGHQNFCVDHDHQTDEVRGLLCHSCNRAIGLLKDDPRLLAAAIKYLSKEA